ncbi:unnamed protein product [uncultured virus]|nr:unnamed protein product [uncultured virus]
MQSRDDAVVGYDVTSRQDDMLTWQLIVGGLVDGEDLSDWVEVIWQ